MEQEKEQLEAGGTTRREFLKTASRVGLGLGLIGLGGALAARQRGEGSVWQIDPHKCVMCGRCATECVLPVSAVRCMHNHEMCGYCDLCFGYFLPGHTVRHEGAENQVCPLGAIARKRIEGDYFEYNIDTQKCNGCAKCVKLCTHSGNGSLFLQVQQDLCAQCNECAITRACPSGAITRIPQQKSYLLKKSEK